MPDTPHSPSRETAIRAEWAEHDLLLRSSESLRFLLRVVDDCGGQMSDDEKTNVRVLIERLEKPIT
jgi:hypothetical protein